MNENGFSLELRDLWKVYRSGEEIIHALSRINYSFKSGSFNLVHGHSGCGKSTLIRVAGLLETPTMGEVLINGKSTADMSQKKRNSLIRDEIGFVFKGSNLIPTLNALENLTLPMTSKNTEKAKELLEKVGFTDYKKLPGKMSFEELQRVSIARAMVNNHSIILADEPTGDLHTGDAEIIIKLLLELNKSKGLTIILTTNNRKLSEHHDVLIEMVDGTLPQFGHA
jgi:putative ABC transport system ATP-binding protein